MDENLIDVTVDLRGISSGLLGATAYGEHAAAMIENERLLMIERRILRIEMALRRSGVEVEMIDPPR